VRSQLRGLPREAWVVLVGDGLSAIGTGLTLPFLVVYLHRVRGVDLESAALAVSVLALAGLAGNPVSGSLADRIGARNTLAMGLVVAATGAGAMALADNAWQGFGAAALVGFGAAVIWPAQDALLAALVPAARRARVFALRYATMNAGLGIGALTAAVIVDVGSPASFAWVYALDAMSFLAFVPILLLGVGAATGRLQEEARGGSRGGYRAIVRDRRFMRLWALTALLVTVGYAQVDAAFPAFATRAGGIGAGALAVANAANTIAVVVAQLLVLRLAEGRRRTSALVGVCAFFAATWGLTLAAGGLGDAPAAVAVFAAAMVAFAFGEMLVSSTLPAIVNDLAPDALRGRYNGVYVLAWTTGFAVGPAIAGLALAHGHSTALFLGLIGACGLAGVWAMRLELDPVEAGAPSALVAAAQGAPL
jgi:MFS family permease